MWDYLIVPFAAIMQFFMKLFNNYALALMLYAVVARLVVFPLAMKQQKNTLNMVRLRPYQEALAKKYGNNREKYNMELQNLYQREGYNPMSSCLPLLIQLPLIYIVYSIVRHPITFVYYGELFTKNTAQRIYDVALTLENLPDALQKVMDKIASGASVNTISNYELQIMQAAGDKFNIPGNNLLGIIDLNGTPNQDFFSWMLLIPIFAGLTGILLSWISQKLNAVQQDPSMQGSNKMMTYMMPIITVFFCYSLNCALGFYWIMGNILGIAQTLILHKMYDPKKVLAEVEAKMEREKEIKKEKRSAAAAKKAAAIAASKKKK